MMERMSRVARVVVPGFPHHVTQRGNRQADVFETDADRECYLRFLKRYADRHGLAIWAYCLMTNHIHLVAVPLREDSLALSLRDAHTVYAMYFNTRTRQSGHVWRGRFYSSPMDSAHLWAAVHYVECNPVRARLVKRAQDYRWSSAAAHCALRRDPILANDFPEPGVIADWSDWLGQSQDDETQNFIRRRTHSGRPCGPKTFVEQIEHLLKRTLHPQKRGPKTKTVTRQETSKKTGPENR